MWTVTGEDEDGIPDGDDDVFFGVQLSRDWINSPKITGSQACRSIALRLRNEDYGATTVEIAGEGEDASLSIGEGGLSVSEGNAFQSWSKILNSVLVVLAADQTWSHRTSGFRLECRITGDYGITITGDTHVHIGFASGKSDFSGGTVQKSGLTKIGAGSTLEDGVLVSGPLGTGPITLTGGILSSYDGWGRTLHNAVFLSGDISFGQIGTGKLTFSSGADGAVFDIFSEVDGAVRVMTLDASVEIGTPIGESGGGRKLGFHKKGTGKLTLSGDVPNSYSGGTTVSDGTLEAKKEGALGLGDVVVREESTNSVAKLSIAGGIISAIDDSACLVVETCDGNAPEVELGDGVVEIIRKLNIDGAVQPVGTTYGGPDSDAVNKLDGIFSGTGIIRAAGDPGTFFLVH